MTSPGDIVVVRVGVVLVVDVAAAVYWYSAPAVLLPCSDGVCVPSKCPGPWVLTHRKELYTAEYEVYGHSSIFFCTRKTQQSRRVGTVQTKAGTEGVREGAATLKAEHGQMSLQLQH